MKKPSRRIASVTFFSTLLLLAGTQRSEALPTCNFRSGLANEFRCENGERYLCRLNGVGSFSPDSGKWIHRGKCTENSSFEGEAVDVKEIETQDI